MSEVCEQGWVEIGAILRSGVYALLFNREVVYIGKAKELYSRIYTHRRTLLAKRKRGTVPKGWNRAIPFSDIRVWPCEIEDMDLLEQQMITKYRPRYNVNLKPEMKVSLEVAGFDFATLIPQAHPERSLRRR